MRPYWSGNGVRLCRPSARADRKFTTAGAVCRSVVALVGPEQAELCRRIARGLADAEMAESVRGEQAAARGPLQIAALDQIRLDDVFDRIARLRQSGGHRLDADRTAAIVL